MNSSLSSPPPLSAGTPGWPGCGDWWIRSRWPAKCWSSPVRQAWARRLLADTADRARSAGVQVLLVTGRESVSRLAFAGLHQLLRPVLSSAATLPRRQAEALAGALGLAADPVAPDPLPTGMAVLTLLSDLSERSPVLVIADDAQWLDRSSLDALSFAGSRLDAERVVLLVGARGQAPPPGL